MAKVIGPLMSMDARGKLADSLVFMGWRGVKDVRMWKKPSNPKTAAQLEIRGYFAQAATAYKSLSPADKSAWGRVASGLALSGYNAFIKAIVNVLKASGTWALITGVEAEFTGGDSMSVTGTTSDASLLRVEWGTRPGVYTGYADESTGRTEAGDFTISVNDLPANSTIYYRVVTQPAASTTGQSGEYVLTPA